ncbi:type IV toxin-antitoxin system AbiEi family antitoxin [Legionella micdadei]|uniref:type IV toxin-antitoxin system AbiEi family antitoxin n=1 Tax=Legionella micdadei TaxID=451 RepID=UPI0005D42976|nr:type IV toxin-antitoxin system AbiEi family antitoxin [Legionella micdadei]
MNTTNYLNHLAAQGQHCFTTDDMMHALKMSQTAVWAAITRLEKKGVIATPHRGFHIIVPPEFQRPGCLPPDQFIPDLMTYLQIPYYVGLLSAAQYYGASHQQAQTFQVLVPKNRKKIQCGQIRVEFIARKNIYDIPTKNFNTPKGYVKISSPEATALDLANYPMYCGGLSNVLTTLEELAEQIQPQALERLANQLPSSPQLQRLGFMFEAGQLDELAMVIETILRKRTIRAVALVPKITNQDMDKPINKRWKVIQNEMLESDL